MSCLRPPTRQILRSGTWILTLLVATLVPNPLHAAEPGESPPVDFNRDIRPILADNCYACHGPDQNQRMAGLRLDLQDSALGRLDSGHRAIVPGNPEESQLIRRITAGDEALKMPPAYSGKELTRQQIDLLTRWIRQGAPWSRHWAYVRPERPPLPKVADKSWPANAIDFFILARLEREGISPSPEAD
ncbi:MAG: c-type cytochrome, partial [Acidobacteria bacterium]|nr:c-type cytochrome [Acidobacteriota bacterium]